jgi:hypothetical protein
MKKNKKVIARGLTVGTKVWINSDTISNRRGKVVAVNKEWHFPYEVICHYDDKPVSLLFAREELTRINKRNV